MDAFSRSPDEAILVIKISNLSGSDNNDDVPFVTISAVQFGLQEDQSTNPFRNNPKYELILKPSKIQPLHGNPHKRPSSSVNHPYPTKVESKNWDTCVFHFKPIPTGLAMALFPLSSGNGWLVGDEGGGKLLAIDRHSALLAVAGSSNFSVPSTQSKRKRDCGIMSWDQNEGTTNERWHPAYTRRCHYVSLIITTRKIV